MKAQILATILFVITNGCLANAEGPCDGSLPTAKTFAQLAKLKGQQADEATTQLIEMGPRPDQDLCQDTPASAAWDSKSLALRIQISQFDNMASEGVPNAESYDRAAQADVEELIKMGARPQNCTVTARSAKWDLENRALMIKISNLNNESSRLSALSVSDALSSVGVCTK